MTSDAGPDRPKPSDAVAPKTADAIGESAIAPSGAGSLPEAGRLVVVSTPIGNLRDLSPRARDALAKADVILCEDTRHTRKLTEHCGVRKPLESYHEFNEANKAPEVAARLASGLSAVLVSDAGTPALSDPGYRLIRLCREQGIPVIPIPGPSAAVAALAVSGLPSDEFLFLGFLPPKSEARRRKLASLEHSHATLVFFEAPHRIRKMLSDAAEVLGNRRAFVGREMTKLHEEYLWGDLETLAACVREQGEFVVIVEGVSNATGIAKGRSGPDLASLSRQDVLKLAAEHLGVKRGELYDALFRKKKAD